MSADHGKRKDEVSLIFKKFQECEAGDDEPHHECNYHWCKKTVGNKSGERFDCAHCFVKYTPEDQLLLCYTPYVRVDRRIIGTASFLPMYGLAMLTLIFTVSSGYNSLNSTTASFFALCAFSFGTTACVVRAIHSKKPYAAAMVYAVLLVHTLLAALVGSFLLASLWSAGVHNTLFPRSNAAGLLALTVYSLLPAFSAYQWISSAGSIKKNTAFFTTFFVWLPITLFNLIWFFVIGYFVLVGIFPEVFGLST